MTKNFELTKLQAELDAAQAEKETVIVADGGKKRYLTDCRFVLSQQPVYDKETNELLFKKDVCHACGIDAVSSYPVRIEMHRAPDKEVTLPFVRLSDCYTKTAKTGAKYDHAIGFQEMPEDTFWQRVTQALRGALSKQTAPV